MGPIQERQFCVKQTVQKRFGSFEQPRTQKQSQNDFFCKKTVHFVSNKQCKSVLDLLNNPGLKSSRKMTFFVWEKQCKDGNRQVCNLAMPQNRWQHQTKATQSEFIVQQNNIFQSKSSTFTMSSPDLNPCIGKLKPPTPAKQAETNEKAKEIALPKASDGLSAGLKTLSETKEEAEIHLQNLAFHFNGEAVISGNLLVDGSVDAEDAFVTVEGWKEEHEFNVECLDDNEFKTQGECVGIRFLLETNECALAHWSVAKLLTVTLMKIRPQGKTFHRNGMDELVHRICREFLKCRQMQFSFLSNLTFLFV